MLPLWKGTIMVVIFSCCIGSALAQSKPVVIQLNAHATLQGVIETVDHSKHKYDTCTAQGSKSICRIDGKNWYGSTGGLNLPKTQLTRLALKVGHHEVELETGSMFNPDGDVELKAEQFTLVKSDVGYMLTGRFAAGSASYTARWIILENKSIRTKIAAD